MFQLSGFYCKGKVGVRLGLETFGARIRGLVIVVGLFGACKPLHMVIHIHTHIHIYSHTHTDIVIYIYNIYIQIDICSVLTVYCL